MVKRYSEAYELPDDSEIGTGFTAVDCTRCGGTAVFDGDFCRSCDGRGRLKVATPAVGCLHCGGRGTPTLADRSSSASLSSSSVCQTCLGTGWASVVWF